MTKTAAGSSVQTLELTFKENDPQPSATPSGPMQTLTGIKPLSLTNWSKLEFCSNQMALAHGYVCMRAIKPTGLGRLRQILSDHKNAHTKQVWIKTSKLTPRQEGELAKYQLSLLEDCPDYIRHEAERFINDPQCNALNFSRERRGALIFKRFPLKNINADTLAELLAIITRSNERVQRLKIYL